MIATTDTDLADLLANPTRANDLSTEEIVLFVGEVGRLDAILKARLVCTTFADAREKLGQSAPIEIPDNEMLTVQEVARILNRSPKYVRELARNDTITGQKNGNRWEFTPEAVDEYQNQHQGTGLDQAVSHPYNAVRDRTRVKKNQKTTGNDPEGDSRTRRGPLEHHRKVRKRQTGNSRTVVPFSYDHLKDEGTESKKVQES